VGFEISKQKIGTHQETRLRAKGTNPWGEGGVKKPENGHTLFVGGNTPPPMWGCFGRGGWSPRKNPGEGEKGGTPTQGFKRPCKNQKDNLGVVKKTCTKGKKGGVGVQKKGTHQNSIVECMKTPDR